MRIVSLASRILIKKIMKRRRVEKRRCMGLGGGGDDSMPRPGPWDWLLRLKCFENLMNNESHPNSIC